MDRGVLTGLCLLLCVSVTGAHAGAWTQPDGGGQIITSTIRTIAPAGAFFDGVAETDRNATKLFAEYGLTSELTIGGTFFGEFSTTSVDVTAQLGAHARYLVWQGYEGDVISIEAGVSFPVERWFGSTIGDSQPDSATEIDLRALYGRGWQSAWGSSFLSAEFGFRIRGEGLSEQVELDATLGYEPFKGILGLFSVFSSVPFNGESDGPSFVLSPSIAYTLYPWLGDNDKRPEDALPPNTIQLAIFWDAAQRGEGLGVGVSIWRPF